MNIYPLNFLWQNILSWFMTDVFNNRHIMAFENNIHWYTYKYLEIKDMQIYFSLLLLTSNVPLRTGKCNPKGYMHPRLGTSEIDDCIFSAYRGTFAINKLSSDALFNFGNSFVGERREKFVERSVMHLSALVFCLPRLLQKCAIVLFFKDCAQACSGLDQSWSKQAHRFRKRLN